MECYNVAVQFLSSNKAISLFDVWHNNLFVLFFSTWTHPAVDVKNRY